MDGRWCFDDLVTTLPTEVKEHILSLPFYPSSIDDCWVWKHKIDGNLSVQVAYSWLLDRERVYDSTKHWRWVWQFRVLEKISFLVWLCMHEALPVNVFRHRRGLSHTPTCLRCSHEAEDILHCMRHCPHSYEVWMWLGFV